MAQQVAALDQLDAHVTGQEGVLEVGRVVHARREQHDRRHGGGRRGDVAQRREQLLRVLVDAEYAVALEERRELALHGGAVLEHVAGARGRAQVVLEHEVLAVLVAHDVDAGDMRIDAAGRVEADHLASEVPRAEDEIGRDFPVAQDALTVVDVGQEGVERVHALDHAALDVVPLVARDHARDEVEREDPLEPFLLAVDGEADALVEERRVDRVPARRELLDAQRRELLGERAVVGPGSAGRLEHLVEERPGLIAALEGENGCLGRGGHGSQECRAPSPDGTTSPPPARGVYSRGQVSGYRLDLRERHDVDRTISSGVEAVLTVPPSKGRVVGARRVPTAHNEVPMTENLTNTTIAPGVDMPLVGLGTWQASGSEAYEACRRALEVGYRHIDTATMYGNEAAVGRAVRDSGLPRDEIFVTTKLPSGSAGRERETIAASLSAMQLDRVDLWLIHWPPGGQASPQVWERFVQIRAEGLARAIGVSNYSPAQIDELIAATGVTPSVNQIPWSPALYDAASRRRASRARCGARGLQPVQDGEPASAGARRDRGAPRRQHASGRRALARRTRFHRHPEVHRPGAHRGQLRRLRVRARRRRSGTHRRPQGALMTNGTPDPGASIAVASLPNLRELGGWQTAGGGRVRRGLLYRSTALGKLSDADLELVGALGLRCVYDFRTEAERTDEPDRVPAGAEYVVVDVLADAPGAGPAQLLAVLGDPPKAAEMLSGGKAEALFEHGYRQLVVLDSALRGYHRFFSEVAQEPHRPALYHCTTGKDRTGWASAALLMLLGVSEDDVLREYLLTNEQLVPALQPILDQFAANGGDPDILRPVIGVEQGYLAAALDEMHTRYGTIERYFTDGLGLGPDVQAALRDALIERT